MGRAINEIIVHCSATPEGRIYDDPVATFRKWHMKPVSKGGLGANDVGYHYVVDQHGKRWTGRPVEKVGAHVKGHNTGTIGVCYVGGVDANDIKKAKDTRTPAQRKAMLELLTELVEKYDIKKISGHRDYAAKACPSFNAAAEYMPLVLTKPPVKVVEKPVPVVKVEKDPTSTPLVVGGIVTFLIAVATAFGEKIQEFFQWLL